jgi:hypothetical protein
VIIPSRQRALLGALPLVAAVLGTLVAVHYHRLDLTLSHYDARGHLVVARRIFDSLTPGWRQIGAIWLPLPHLLNAVPVQFDPFYRTGASAVALSIASFAAATTAIARIVVAATGSARAALVAAAVFALNPDVLYLQATPMTEPLLLGLLLSAIAALMSWSRGGQPSPSLVGALFALACLTRYEAWPVTAAALGLAFWARARARFAWGQAALDALRIGVWPAVAVAGFMIFSKVVVGAWFVSSGFFVPDNPAKGQPLAAAASVLWGVGQLTGRLLLVVASIGLLSAIAAGVADRRRAILVLPLSLVAAAALPFAAFVSGHPYRIRYMVPLVAAVAIGAGVAAGISSRVRTAALVLVLVVAGAELRPLSPVAPMVLEAQWDQPNARERARVTACLREMYDGRLILASMGSLGHYMQELSHVGLRLRDFVHEGNEPWWSDARAGAGPGPDVGWIMISEGTDGRDALYRPAQENPAILRGFSRVCEGGSVALYRRDRRLSEAPGQNRAVKVTR